MKKAIPNLNVQNCLLGYHFSFMFLQMNRSRDTQSTYFYGHTVNTLINYNNVCI